MPVAAREERVVLPPVDSHLAGLVGRRDQQPDLDRQQLDIEQVDLDVARNHDSLVEDALEHVRELRRLAGPVALKILAAHWSPRSACDSCSSAASGSCCGSGSTSDSWSSGPCRRSCCSRRALSSPSSAPWSSRCVSARAAAAAAPTAAPAAATFAACFTDSSGWSPL